MIDQVDREVQTRIKGTVGNVDVLLGPPSLLNGKHGISLYLLALTTPSPAWINRIPPAPVALRYLVTAWAAEEEEAHRLLGTLLLALLEKRDYEVELNELPAQLWSTLGIAPRPAFLLRVPLAVERPQPAVKLVQGPLEIHMQQR